MKKIFSVSLISAVAASMLSLNSFASPIYSKVFSSDNIKGAIIFGTLSLGENGECDMLPDFKPDINLPGQDNDSPSDDNSVVPPLEDGDTPSVDNETNNPDSGVGNPSGDSDSEGTHVLNEYEKEVIGLVNEIRVQNGLDQLSIDTQLSRVARIKSQDMKDNGYFSHQSPVYGSPFDMMKQFGVSYRTAGENIAKGQSSPQSVVEAWMNSSGHRANILNSSFTRIGMGYIADGHYWTQMFAG